MIPADTFRCAYDVVRAAGLQVTRQEFVTLVLTTPLFTRRIRGAARAWADENPMPEAATQRRHGWLHTREEPQAVPRPLRPLDGGRGGRS